MSRLYDWLQEQGNGTYGIIGLPGTGKTTLLTRLAIDWPGDVFTIDPLHHMHLKERALTRIKEGAKSGTFTQGCLVVIDEIDLWILEDTDKRWNWIRNLLKKARNIEITIVWTSHSITDVPYWAWRSVAKGFILGRLPEQDHKIIRGFNNPKLNKVFTLPRFEFVLYPIMDVVK